MKIFFALLLGSILSHADTTLKNPAGFATCFETQSQVYFFDWDPFIRTTEKSLHYFTLKDYVRVSGHSVKHCKDQAFIHDVPSEILRDVSELKGLVPDDVLLSLQQIASGASVYRSEKTAAEYVANRPEIFKADRPEVLSHLREEVGEGFATEVMNLFIGQIVSENRSCQSLIGTCDFYLCQEKKNPCGIDGYNLDFGYKYCSGSKFKLLDEMKTGLGKSWVTEVFNCLQTRNLENFEKMLPGVNTCAEIKKESYDSHPDCYVKAGFCQLKGGEKLKIFNLIKSEILSAQTLTQGISLIKQCAAEKN